MKLFNITEFLKRHVACVTIVFMLTALLLAVLSYSGFCFKSMRYLSGYEKSRLVVHKILENYPPRIFLEKKDQMGTTSYSVQPKNPVFYKDINEFFLLNPDCCEFTLLASKEGMDDTADFWSKLCGKISGYVKVDYLVRYRNEDNELQSMPWSLSVPVSNCGANDDRYIYH